MELGQVTHKDCDLSYRDVFNTKKQAIIKFWLADTRWDSTKKFVRLSNHATLLATPTVDLVLKEILLLLLSSRWQKIGKLVFCFLCCSLVAADMRNLFRGFLRYSHHMSMVTVRFRMIHHWWKCRQHQKEAIKLENHYNQKRWSFITDDW
jgi:hypothetical protein